VRRFIAVVLLIIMSFGAGLSLSLSVVSEGYVKLWEQRVESADYILDQNIQVMEAHNYSQTLMETLRVVTVENSLLCERDAKRQRVLLGLEEELSRLKCSLQEAVEMMQDQIEENNSLHDEVDSLRYKVVFLENVIETLNEIHEKLETEETNETD